MICEEFDPHTAFADGTLAVTKQLFDGAGGLIRHDLYEKYKVGYKDIVFVIATNALPATEAQGRDEWNKNLWKPMLSRVEISSLSHSHEDGTRFPYTVG